MAQRPTLAQMFEYSPDVADLTGFPNSAVLTDLSRLLGLQGLLNGYSSNCKPRALVPTFNPEYVLARQNFFQNIPGDAEDLFQWNFPSADSIDDSEGQFFRFCDSVHSSLCNVREELKPFRHMPEARRILRRVGDLDSDLRNSLKALNTLGHSRYFGIDSETGIVVRLPNMPVVSSTSPHLTCNSGSHPASIDFILSKIKLRMKREALKAVRGGLRGFRRRIREYTGQELVYIADTDNLRREVGQFALPVRLHREYIGFIRACADFPGEVALGGEEVDRTVSARYPKFASCYDIQGLYPPSLLREHSDPRRHTPIYFKTNTGEKKFLLAGLHSGGKSFLLENLVLLSILGQIPFEMSADKLVIPRYKHIFYYNADNSRGRENGSGKWEAEMRQVNRIIDQARAGDLVVFDEFLDSTHSSVSTWLLPEILGRLGRLAATVFVSTHRGVDYQAIQDTGWVVMSPEHKVKEGKIVPIHRLKRGIPDEQANQAYVKQRYQDALKRHSY